MSIVCYVPTTGFFVQDRAPLEVVSVKDLGSLRDLFSAALLFVTFPAVRLYVTTQKRDTSYAIWSRWSSGGCCFQSYPLSLDVVDQDLLRTSTM